MDALDQKKKKRLIMETRSCSGKLLKAGSESDLDLGGCGRNGSVRFACILEMGSTGLEIGLRDEVGKQERKESAVHRRFGLRAWVDGGTLN